MQAIKVLQADIDETEDSSFRLLVQGNDVKYVTIAPDLFSTDELCFAPTLLRLLPALPAGDWNTGHIGRSNEDSKPCFVSTTRTDLPTISNRWHPVSVDHLQLTYGHKLRSGVYEVTLSESSALLVAKFARFHWEIPALDHECSAYEWIEGHDIGPKFYGLLTEGDRCIGFLIERVVKARHATPDDLSACQTTLAKLHTLGILHGDVNKHNFLIAGQRAVLIDFDSAQPDQKEASLLREMASLPGALADSSGRGGSSLIAQGLDRIG